ncbi:MAG: 4Fe-4S dicluster domain-containing protein [Saprospiraceae bacterium]
MQSTGLHQKLCSFNCENGLGLNIFLHFVYHLAAFNQMAQTITFLLITLIAFTIAGRKFYRIYQNINMGKPGLHSNEPGQRWRNVFLVALGQKKMFARPIPALLHMAIYTAFVLTQIELIEIFVDGIFGTHRFFAHYLGGFYNFIISFIEVLSLLAFIATVAFLYRRNIMRLARFKKPEMKGWPSIDANIILCLEILLIIGIFTMNGADNVMQSRHEPHYPQTGGFLLSSVFGPWFFGELPTGFVYFLERFGWWLHIMVVYGFLVYLAFSKHLHILLAFPNTFYARLSPKGQMENMPAVMNEVKSMLGLPIEPVSAEEDIVLEFGASDIFQMSQTTLMGAYTCTECGRCTSVCPANLTGKKLSPRKVMMDIRDRMEEVRTKLESGNPEWTNKEARKKKEALTLSNFDDGKNLFDYITREEIHACTSCNACVEACPILINPLDPILDMRRFEILMESAGPAEWLPMFNALENSQAVWQMPVERAAWANVED